MARTLADYTTQSPFSDPGVMTYVLNDYPANIPALSGLAQALALRTAQVAAEGRGDIDTRYADQVFARIHRLVDVSDLGDLPDPKSSPDEPHLAERERDVAFLTVALLRHHGVPARMRVGYSPTTDGDHYKTRVLAEAWDDEAHAWQPVTTSTRFIPAAVAWVSARTRQDEPSRWANAPEKLMPTASGWKSLVRHLLLDLAALNRYEMQLADTWGMLRDLHNPDESERQTLDELAGDMVVHADESAIPSQLGAWFAYGEFGVPGKIMAQDAQNEPLLPLYIRQRSSEPAG